MQSSSRKFRRQSILSSDYLANVNIRKLIVEYLEEAKVMQLATSVDDQPWVCNVWFAADKDLNIYWFSIKTRRHSKEIMKNNKVAGNFALPKFGPLDKVRCVEFEGVASELTDRKDVEKAVAVYADRIFTRDRIEQLTMTKPYAFYKAKPKLFVLFDAVNFPEDPRQELRV